MKIKYLITGCIFILFMGGCSSTQNSNKGKNQNITVPEAYQVMADFGIISQYDANQMAKTGKMALAKNINNFKSSVAGQLTNDGSMLAGFAIAQFFGGGVSLSNFFNPSIALFKSTAYANNLKKPYLFIPVEDDCNKECANKKLMEIVQTIAKYTAENYSRELDAAGIRPYSPINVGETKKVKYDHHVAKIVWSGKKSWAYDAEFLNLDNNDLLNKLSFLAVYDADFFTIKGKRYYGSKVSTSEGFHVYLRMLGFPETRLRDNSMVLGMAKASQKHDFIYIQTLRGYIRNLDGEYKPGNKAQTSAIGDFMIKDGTYTQLGIYTHPDNLLKDLDKMNHIGVQIKHALDDLVPEVLAEAGSSSNETKMTASSEVAQGS